MSTIKIVTDLVFEEFKINRNIMHIEIASIKQNITISLQVVIMKFEIRYFETMKSMIYAVYYQMILIFKAK